MTSIGAEVGFVLDLGDGTLKRVKGFLVEQDVDTVVVAVTSGIAPEGSVPLEVLAASGSTSQVNFVRVTATEVTTDIAAWTKASCFAEPQVVTNLLRAFYKDEVDIKRVETDSMVSAQSMAQQAHLSEAAAGLVTRM